MNSAVQDFSEMKKVAGTILYIYKKQLLLNVLLGYRSWEVYMKWNLVKTDLFYNRFRSWFP